MRKPRPLIVLSFVMVGVVVTSLACSNAAPTPSRNGAPRKRSPTAAAPAPQYPMIVRIVGRHQTITVTAGPAGPLYSAATSDGKAIVAGATLDELRDRHPAVYRQLHPGIAIKGDDDSGTGRARKASEKQTRGEPLSTTIRPGRMPVLMASSAE